MAGRRLKGQRSPPTMVSDFDVCRAAFGVDRPSARTVRALRAKPCVELDDCGRLSRKLLLPFGEATTLSIGFRQFLFPDDGPMELVPLWLVNQLVHRGAALPQYAGKKVRAAFVTLRLKDRVPVRISNVSGEILHFDEAGRLDRKMWDDTLRLLPAAMALEGSSLDDPVVDFTSRRRIQMFNRTYRWDPTPADITKIVYAIWPHQSGGLAPKRAVTKTTLKRKVPMTYEAKQALSELGSPLYTLLGTIAKLSTKDLQGLADEIRERLPREELDERPMWEGIIRTAEQQIQLRKARQRVTGKWYAVAQVMTWETEERDSGKLEPCEAIECKGQKAAVEAGKALYRKYSRYFSPLHGIEVELMTEMEWQGKYEDYRPKLATKVEPFEDERSEPAS